MFWGTSFGAPSNYPATNSAFKLSPFILNFIYTKRMEEKKKKKKSRLAKMKCGQLLPSKVHAKWQKLKEFNSFASALSTLRPYCTHFCDNRIPGSASYITLLRPGPVHFIAPPSSRWRASAPKSRLAFGSGCSDTSEKPIKRAALLCFSYVHTWGRGRKRVGEERVEREVTVDALRGHHNRFRFRRFSLASLRAFPWGELPLCLAGRAWISVIMRARRQ